jgi:hypothetical protein
LLADSLCEAIYLFRENGLFEEQIFHVVMMNIRVLIIA